MDMLIVFLVVVLAAAVVGLIAYILYRVLRPRLKDDKPSDEEILQDEMSRVLQDVEDEEVAKQISNYKDDE
ncbi:MAG: hypothetical protein MJ216_01795 [Bacilli bacterium]|nr:hypothetical protein [Bacilli bacterium]